ncbi:MAG: energy transducer TonB [Terriglobales bacterium]
MRPLRVTSGILSLLILSLISSLISTGLAAQNATQEHPPQTARQALIEMCFSEAPGHFEKHLPTITRQTFSELGQENGPNYTGILSALQMQTKAAGGKFETFDVGPTLFKAKGLPGRVDDEVEITVERDDLVGGEDQIELALHTTTNGKEETLLPTILRFTFSMKMEGDIWRLSEVSATARFPIADPTFLKAMQEHQAGQNEQMALMSVRSIVSAEKSYQSARSSFACKLSDLGNSGKDAPRRTYLFDQQLASGKKNGYVFSISECDPSHYRLAAEPVAPELGQHAYCSDEAGTVRKSGDGKVATCFASGEVVEEKVPAAGMLRSAPQNPSTSAASNSARIRISQGVATGLLVTKVSPVYPPSARQARIQGDVVLKAIINETGDVTSAELVSGHPMLFPAALEAVRQWKYRPYLLNGKAVGVETQVTVSFTLLGN